MNRLFYLSSIIIFLGAVTGISTSSEKLVIDTDAGGDDATAILLATQAWAHNDSNFEVIAVTCVNGNTGEKNVERNVLKILTIANASHIPVYGGAQKPFLYNTTMDDYFGHDGLGDFNFTKTITAKLNKSMHAAVALVDLAKRHKGQLNILALGPLTNLALAIALDPSFVDNVKRLYIMGGSVEGVGNMSPGVEFNFGLDPESNFVVFNQTGGKPSLLVPWETIAKAKISKKWRLKTLGSIKSEVVDFLNLAENVSLNATSNIWTSADAMATAIMIWPKFLMKSVVKNINPVVDGAARGSLLVDYYELSGRPKNAEIVQEFNVAEFKSKILQHFE